ncbi:MAG: HAD-IA family hydrolase [Chitinispirillia bacterium]|jgi:pyrophosphatase PpaX
MKTYRAYLFDADGTLFDTTEMIFQCFKYSCKKYGNLSVTRKQVFKNIGLPLKIQFECLFGALSNERTEELIKAHMEYQLKIFKKYLRLFPGVAETLKMLKNNEKKLAIVTSRRMESLLIFLKDTNIFNLFNILITPESTEKHKPLPEPALEALKQLNCKNSESLFIGDATFDIECGKNAGMDTAFVSWSKNPPSSLNLKPTYILNDIYDLAKL